MKLVETRRISTNSFNTNIQFTVEKEENQKINFLDMTIHKIDQKLITNWYKTETSSGRILNFLSAHPFHSKINIATAFAKRVIDLSHSKFHKHNFKIIHNILIENNYPNNIIKKIINKIRSQPTQSNSNHTHQNNSSSNNTSFNQNIPLINTPKKSYYSISYIPKLSENINKIVTENNPNINFAYKPTKQLKKVLFSKTKTKIPKIPNKIPCSECDGVYIGQTSKKATTRVKQHKYDFKTRFSNPNKTSLVKHTIDTNHKFDYDNVEILDTENNRKKRELLEATYIIAHSPNSVNKKSDSEYISRAFMSPIITYTKLSKLSPIKKQLQK